MKKMSSQNLALRNEIESLLSQNQELNSLLKDKESKSFPQMLILNNDLMIRQSLTSSISHINLTLFLGIFQNMKNLMDENCRYQKEQVRSTSLMAE